MYGWEDDARRKGEAARNFSASATVTITTVLEQIFILFVLLGEADRECIENEDCMFRMGLNRVYRIIIYLVSEIFWFEVCGE
jgi:hypothetical protein